MDCCSDESDVNVYVSNADHEIWVCGLWGENFVICNLCSSNNMYQTLGAWSTGAGARAQVMSTNNLALLPNLLCLLTKRVMSRSMTKT